MVIVKLSPKTKRIVVVAVVAFAGFLIYMGNIEGEDLREMTKLVFELLRDILG